MIIQFLMEGTAKADSLVRLCLLGLVVIATIGYFSKKLLRLRLSHSLPFILAGYAISQILFNILIGINHINFPLNLEAMELLRLQHLQRLMQGLPLYPEPSSDFIALAYNPLFYLFSVPFASLFGDTLSTLRLVAILGMIGAGAVIFFAIRRHTASNWWSLMAVGLFAAAYRAMDCYLDMAHADSWLLFTVLLGCYLLERSQSRWVDHGALLILIAAFWFKQQGSVFVIGAIGFLTWRYGLKQAWTFWLMAVILGAGLYLGMPDWALGPKFHYFTWQVPRQWVEITGSEIKQLLRLIMLSYPVLAIASGTFMILGRQSGRSEQPNIWYFMLPIAGLSAALAVCTPGSNNNVYIPLGTWLIMTGTLSLYHWVTTHAAVRKWDGHLLAISLAYVCFAYYPPSVLVPPPAAAYRDLVNYVRALPGAVYAPWLGALPAGRLSPAVHWVSLDDVLRGPGQKLPGLAVATLLQPVFQPATAAYILHNYPLAQDSRLRSLQDRYVLDQDLGQRFQALSTLPRRYQLDYPRYLYRYVAQ